MADIDIARSILNNAAPAVARELVTITLGSDDPDDHRRYLELVHKLNSKDGPQAGVTVNFKIDMANGGFSASTVPVVEEVKDGPKELPAPEPAEVIDLASFFEVPAEAEPAPTDG